MRIKYSDFHPDPALRGVINDKLPRHRAQAAVDSGLAVEIPYASYRERIAAESAAQAVPQTDSWGRHFLQSIKHLIFGPVTTRTLDKSAGATRV